MSTTAAASHAPHPAPGTQRHPLGLYVLFGTEMWERFSYYGMRALLVLYLVEHHGWQPEQSSGVYKWYTSLVYLTPLLGGLLADRFLGLRASIITGGVLMAIGHFLMAFEPLPMFYTALAFLIAGNGFFKPNISTLVGRMYGKDDERRDGAFTIFYMGINIGAFFAPLVCGWLRTNYGFHWGFGAAGVGMVIGLTTFLLGQGRVLAAVEQAGNHMKTLREMEQERLAAKPEAGSKETGYRDQAAKEAETTDEQKPGATGLASLFSRGYPIVLMLVSPVLPVYYGYLAFKGEVSVTKLVMPIAFGIIAAAMGVTLRTIKGAARDKSITIFLLFCFVVLFWMAFEQAGNALNLWAEFHTRLEIAGYKYPAEWFQSVNAVLIVIFAPLFSILWVRLARKGREPRTPVKMVIAMGFMAASFLVMVFGAIDENAHETSVPFTTAMPAPLRVVPDGQIELVKPPKKPGDKEKVVRFDAGRLTVRGETIHAGAAEGSLGGQTLVVRGVLPKYVVNDLLAAVAPKEVKLEVYGDDDAKIEGLEAKTKGAKKDVPYVWKVPSDTFRYPFEGKDPKDTHMIWSPEARTIAFLAPIDKPAQAELVAGAASPELRDAIWSLEEKSGASRSSALWLFLSYLLATLGELCLSPVGLSMVTKLAPQRFASLFMGVWMLASSLAQYVGGSIGESWGTVAPAPYFQIFVWTSVVGCILLGLLTFPIKKLMHEVH